jgi:hypothetical protein
LLFDFSVSAFCFLILNPCSSVSIRG